MGLLSLFKRKEKVISKREQELLEDYKAGKILDIKDIGDKETK
jgi:hypothetical protein